MKIFGPINNFLNLFYPCLCEVCNEPLVQGEELLCTKCRLDIPVTYSWKMGKNGIDEVFWGRVNIESAVSFFYFAKGSKYRILLHKLKYRDRPDIGFRLGVWFGNELSRVNKFSGIDYIIPVPLHPKKQRARGYNQSEMICRGLSKSMNIKMDTKILRRSEFTESQTKKGRLDRWLNVSSVFSIVDFEKLNGKHILLVDDILTTGATLEACCQAVLNKVNCKISIATLAYAHY